MEAETGRMVRTRIHQEWRRAVGCPATASVAFAAAAAAGLLGEPVLRLEVLLDRRTDLLTRAVAMPHVADKGPALAAAAGALIAEPELGLCVLEPVSVEICREAHVLAADTRVRIATEARDHYIAVKAVGRRHHAEAVVAGGYERLTSCRRNGIAVFSGPAHTGRVGSAEVPGGSSDPCAPLDLLHHLGAAEFAVLRRALEANRALATSFPPPQKPVVNTPAGAAMQWITAGIAACKQGQPRPVYLLNGSGSAGLALTLGPWAAARALGETRDEGRLLSAIALAHLFHTAARGRPRAEATPNLGSAVGLGCAVAWLMGASRGQIGLLARTIADMRPEPTREQAPGTCRLAALSAALEWAGAARADALPPLALPRRDAGSGAPKPGRRPESPYLTA